MGCGTGDMVMRESDVAERDESFDAVQSCDVISVPIYRLIKKGKQQQANGIADASDRNTAPTFEVACYCMHMNDEVVNVRVSMGVSRSLKQYILASHAYVWGHDGFLYMKSPGAFNAVDHVDFEPSVLFGACPGSPGGHGCYPGGNSISFVTRKSLRPDPFSAIFGIKCFPYWAFNVHHLLRNRGMIFPIGANVFERHGPASIPSLVGVFGYKYSVLILYKIKEFDNYERLSNLSCPAVNVVSHSVHLRIGTTSIDSIPDTDVLPHHYFEFCDYEKLDTLRGDSHQLIDFIGLLQGMEEKTTKDHNPFLNLTLTNASDSGSSQQTKLQQMAGKKTLAALEENTITIAELLQKQQQEIAVRTLIYKTTLSYKISSLLSDVRCLIHKNDQNCIT
ncbi:hypothetical protein L1987_61639 [Smallanthus sonchifolius]|uniref:Uncharacterized protein n=1 Tax=Smallanthus sonchifolius TaxID=185202 RepID=A0ACB9C869_9ASTR|nr:hypothetical protein L1987_61639 [Smallanthus sonchifolius]